MNTNLYLDYTEEKFSISLVKKAFFSYSMEPIATTKNIDCKPISKIDSPEKLKEGIFHISSSSLVKFLEAETEELF